MQFSSSFIIAALPFLITAQPLQLKARNDSPTAYTLTAIHSGDQAVNNQPINAANDAFFIGTKPGSVCPTGVTCPAVTDTSIDIADSVASLVRDLSIIIRYKPLKNLIERRCSSRTTNLCG